MKRHSTSEIAILQYNLNDELVKEWSSISSAAKAMKCDSHCISRCLNGKNETCKGFKWKYKESRSKRVITDKMISELREFYKSRPMPISEAARKFGLCLPTTRKYLGDIDVYKKNILLNPELDEHYFDCIDTEEKAYFIGLIIADGNIYDPNSTNHSIEHKGSKWTSISLKCEDEYMLERFSKCVKLSNKISHDGRGASAVNVRSDIMANSLSLYGIVPNKTFFTYFPFNIDGSMHRHVLRGIIDGDGSVQMHKYKGRSGNELYHHDISICGTHRLMSDIVALTVNRLKLSTIANVYDYKNKFLSEIKFKSIHDMYTLGEWIYNDATIYLKRKHDTYLKFKDVYCLD